MTSLLAGFSALPPATSATEFRAIKLTKARSDFLAKGPDGSPIFLLHDASAAKYHPGKELAHVSVQFHCTCRVTTGQDALEDQFAVITCSSAHPDFFDLFIRCVSSSIEALPSVARTNDLQHTIDKLLELFKALSRPGGREIAGLWAELFVISMAPNVAMAVTAWHSDNFERFDFSSTTCRLEIKATTGEMRLHEVSAEQTVVPNAGRGLFASVLLQPLAGGIGILDLTTRIEARLSTSPALRDKLWANVTSSLGSDFRVELDKRYDMSYAERRLKFFLMEDLPSIEKPIDPRISRIRYAIDLTTTESSLASSSIKHLASIFPY